MANSSNGKVLNKNLLIFFKDALKITLKNPAQAFSFLRTIVWLRRAAQLRKKCKKNGYLIPPILIFSITNECNLKCPGCYNKSFHDSNGKELGDEKLWQIAAEAKELGVSFFVIAGGEPFLRPVLLDIMKEYPEIIFLVFTNGTLIDDWKIKRFKEQKNVVPMISLEGNQEETDERRGDGTFEQLQQTMIKMKKLGIFFGLSLTLVRKNFDTITAEEFISKCAKLGCKFFLFLEYTPTQPGTESWVLTDNQRSQVSALMKKYRSKYPALFIAVPWDEDDVGGCLSAGRGFVHINARGDLEPCPFAPFSDTNVRDYSLKDALQSKLCEKIRQTPELAKENGDGCILWKERDLVKSLIE
ncbi:radical SAM protein [candidate division KSB1 bacterium]|nr:radical SAM protein [candidate division KSB1 bacterium]